MWLSETFNILPEQVEGIPYADCVTILEYRGIQAKIKNAQMEKDADN